MRRFLFVGIALQIAMLTSAFAGCTAAQREPYESVIAQIETALAQADAVKQYGTREQYEAQTFGLRQQLNNYQRKIANICGNNAKLTCSDSVKRAYDQRIFALQQMETQYSPSSNESVDEFASYADIGRAIKRLQDEKAKACYSANKQ